MQDILQKYGFLLSNKFIICMGFVRTAWSFQCHNKLDNSSALWPWWFFSSLSIVNVGTLYMVLAFSWTSLIVACNGAHSNYLLRTESNIQYLQNTRKNVFKYNTGLKNVAIVSWSNCSSSLQLIRKYGTFNQPQNKSPLGISPQFFHPMVKVLDIKAKSN